VCVLAGLVSTTTISLALCSISDSGREHPKLAEVLHRDFADCSALADALSGEDAAVFCLGAYTTPGPSAIFLSTTNH
jgi:hypothetical protein